MGLCAMDRLLAMGCYPTRVLKNAFSPEKRCKNRNDFGVDFVKHAFFNSLLLENL